jgi:hypothetical protein
MPLAVRFPRRRVEITLRPGGAVRAGAAPARSGWTTALRAALLLVVMGPGSITLQAQADRPARPGDRYWLNAGLGYGYSHGDVQGAGGLGGSFSVSYQAGAKLFSLRTAGVWELFGAEALGDVALVAGLGTHQKGAHASLALGPGLAGGDIGGGFFGTPTHFHSTLGLALQAQGFGIAFGALGLGLYGFANLNSRHSFGGVTLALQFGEPH